jgi:hypothetical protein
MTSATATAGAPSAQIPGRGQPTAASAVHRRPAADRFLFAHHKTKRAADFSAAPRRTQERVYFRLVAAVRSTESLAMPAAPHQFEPVPPGLIGVTLVVPEALKALVKALQLPFDMSVSE